MSVITIRAGLPKDAPQIANLIMEAMTLDCCAYFHGPDYTSEDFLRLMTELCLQTNSQYSYLNTIVAVSGDEVVGAVVSYDGGRLHELRCAFIEGALQMFHRDFSNIDDETEPGELYLDSFAVKPLFRHQGIGMRLLAETVRKAAFMNLESVGLLVDDNNPEAERLYKRCGFGFVGVSSWGGHGMKHLQCLV